MVDTQTETERRRHPRSQLELAASIERVAGRPLSGPASTVDLSEGGARLRAPAGFVVGDVVRVTLTAEGVAIEQQGLVVGRQEEAAGGATLNIAFKTSDERRTGDLRRLLQLD